MQLVYNLTIKLATGLTGLTGPTFNGSYFHIGETGFNWLLGAKSLPGNMVLTDQIVFQGGRLCSGKTNGLYG